MWYVDITKNTAGGGSRFPSAGEGLCITLDRKGEKENQGREGKAEENPWPILAFRESGPKSDSKTEGNRSKERAAASSCRSAGKIVNTKNSRKKGEGLTLRWAIRKGTNVEEFLILKQTRGEGRLITVATASQTNRSRWKKTEGGHPEGRGGRISEKLWPSSTIGWGGGGGGGGGVGLGGWVGGCMCVFFGFLGGLGGGGGWGGCFVGGGGGGCGSPPSFLLLVFPRWGSITAIQEKKRTYLISKKEGPHKESSEFCEKIGAYPNQSAGDPQIRKDRSITAANDQEKGEGGGSAVVSSPHLARAGTC